MRVVSGYGVRRCFDVFLIGWGDDVSAAGKVRREGTLGVDGVARKNDFLLRVTSP